MILASNAASMFIAAYLIQVPLGIYALFFIPMRGELSAVYENARKGVGTMAILPCAFFSVILQLIFIGMYMAKVKSIERKFRPV